MLPVDEDILLSRYSDQPIAAEYYQKLRARGLQPDEAIQEIEDLRAVADRARIPDISQQQALEQYANAVADIIGKVQHLDIFAPPTTEQIAKLRDAVSAFGEAAIVPITPEKIQELVEQAQRIVDMFLSHSHRSSTGTSNSNPQ